MHAGPRRVFYRDRLRYDGAFRTEVGYCVDKGIPHSEFLARWSNEDRAKLVAFLLEKADQCSICRTADWEWKQNPRAYIPVLHDCMGCKVTKGLQNSLPSDLPDGQSVILVTEREHDRLTFDPKARASRPMPRRRRRSGES